MAEPSIDIKQDVDGNNNIIIGQGANVVINQTADGEREVRRSIPDLLAYRTDRDEQKRILGRAMAKHRKANPSAPFVLLILGEEAENPKAFLDVLQEYTVPELTSDSGAIQHNLLTWPDPASNIDHRLDALGEVLQERMDQPMLDRINICDCSDEDRKQIAGMLARANQPLFFESHLTDRDWQENDIALIDRWMAFWNNLPALDPRHPVVIALCVELRPDTSKFKLFSSHQKKLDAIREAVQAIELNGYEQLGGVLLPELGAIALRHVEAWIETKAFEFGDKASLTRQVRALYALHNDQPLSMEVLAPELNKFVQD